MLVRAVSELDDDQSLGTPTSRKNNWKVALDFSIAITRTCYPKLRLSIDRWRSTRYPLTEGAALLTVVFIREPFCSSKSNYSKSKYILKSCGVFVTRYARYSEHESLKHRPWWLCSYPLELRAGEFRVKYSWLRPTLGSLGSSRQRTRNSPSSTRTMTASHQHDSLQAARARRGATHSEISMARFLAGCWKFNVGRQKFLTSAPSGAFASACSSIELVAYGFLKVA